MFTFIDKIGMGQGSISLAGTSYPEPCVIEDEDGQRLYLTSAADVVSVPVRGWVTAQTLGVAALLVVHGDAMSMMPVDRFIERRSENPVSRAYIVPMDDWGWLHGSSPNPSFREMLSWADAPPAASTGFVHLHAHSHFSALDGLSTITEMLDAVAADDQPALALTDHGVCAGHPVLASEATKRGIKPILGVEAYLVNDRLVRTPPRPNVKDLIETKGKTPEQAEADKHKADALVAEWEAAKAAVEEYYHLILWAQSTEGLHNLWAMTTVANREGFYRHPRIDWDTLSSHSEGVMASTACLSGPVARPLNRYGDDTLARQNLARMIDIFGDRLYVEIHTNGLPEQVEVNHALVKMARQHSLPIIGVSDSHYPCADDKHNHEVWMAIQTNKSIQDERELFAGESDYHLMSADEVRKGLAYLGDDVASEAMANTLVVAERCNAAMPAAAPPPVFSKGKGDRPERIQTDVERLVDLCVANWDDRVGGKGRTEEYLERFEYEMGLLKDKDFCGYFLLVADYVGWAKDQGILVGPGRGSGGGSLVAYLARITEIDPIESGLMFERFLTRGRKGLPDFDVDFPTSKRDVLTDYVVSRWGEDSIVRVGTHTKVKNRGIIRDLFRVFRDSGRDPVSGEALVYTDPEAISKIIDRWEADTAGKGLAWDVLMAVAEEDLAPFVQRYPGIFALAGSLVGRVKSYSRHAAGLVISTESALVDRLPMWIAKDDEKSEGGQMVAEFDMNVLEDLGLVKADFLTLRTLDTIQMALDLIEENTGERLDLYGWRDEYDDPEVWAAIAEGRTLGMFQLETPAMTSLCKQMSPRSLRDLADAVTLVRPGPMRSGLTTTYLRRRHGVEGVSYPHPDLAAVLEPTQGIMAYQEQIMALCQVLGGYTLEEADEVRKILGKKQTEKIAEAGEKFMAACVERGYDRATFLDPLWDQIKEFALYSFNLAHAWAYGLMAYWTAWLKVRYPAEFFCALLSTVDKDRIPVFIREARRWGFSIAGPDINLSGASFTCEGTTIRYGLGGLQGIGPSSLSAIIEARPFDSFEDWLERKPVDMGVTRTLARIGAFDRLVPNRAGLLRRLAWIEDGGDKRCAHHDLGASGPNGLPCRYDWSEEPVEIGKSGRPLKPKPPPKRCTVRCRQYVQGAEPDWDQTFPFQHAQVREIEYRILEGIYLSSFPWEWYLEQWEPEEAATLWDLDRIEEAGMGYTLIRLSKVNARKDRNGRDMAFVEGDCFGEFVKAVVFSSAYKNYSGHLVPGGYILASLKAGDRGWILQEAHLLPKEDQYHHPDWDGLLDFLKDPVKEKK